jgi:NAD(P)-dependent dehydrogenase (short-subunit alcohol dehydrogenase family)
MELGLKGRVAIVTAGGGAICGAVSRELAAEGALVAVWDISREAAERTAASIRSTGGVALAVACDGTDARAIETALTTTRAELGDPEILVNGAGGSSPRTTTTEAQSFSSLDPDAMLEVLKLNYLSAVMTSQAVVPAMLAALDATPGSATGAPAGGRDTGGPATTGAIVNVSSVGGLLPLSRALTYSDAKAAVASFTRWLAMETANRHGGRIRVNAVAPGFALTEQNRFLLEDPQTGEPTERGRQVLSQVPLGRYATAEEIAAVVAFLASARASFITGAVYPVDGGLTASLGV